MGEDAVMSGFRYMKALIGKYGTQRTAELTTLAERLVERGDFPNRRVAIAAIEEQMGLGVTLPISPEVADEGSRRWIEAHRGQGDDGAERSD